MECSDCGFNYVEGLQEDELAHSRVHDEWTNGTTFPKTPNDSVIAYVQGMELLEATPESPRAYRDHFWTAARRAIAKTLFSTPYDGGDEELEWDGRAYVLRMNERAVAFVVVRRRGGHWWWLWEERDSDKAPAGKADSRPRPVIDFAWVLPRLQRSGIGSNLITEIAAHLKTAVNDLAWTLDFSPEGEKLVRHLTKSGFWATR